MYRASDEVTERPWLIRLEQIAASLSIDPETVSLAAELYLSELPIADRSKPVVLAASCYTACLIMGEERSQGAVADAFNVSRLSIQKRWKSQLAEIGLSPPDW